jgi:hypothetical protein
VAETCARSAVEMYDGIVQSDLESDDARRSAAHFKKICRAKKTFRAK